MSETLILGLLILRDGVQARHRACWKQRLELLREQQKKAKKQKTNKMRTKTKERKIGKQGKQGEREREGKKVQREMKMEMGKDKRWFTSFVYLLICMHF